MAYGNICLGNWENFLENTKIISPLIPEIGIPTVGVVATGAEALFGICLILGLKTELLQN